MTTLAIREYQSLPASKKLNFDPSGRPGAEQIREMQKSLMLKRESLKAQVHRADLEKPRDINFRRMIYMANQEYAAYIENDERDGSPRKILGLPLDAKTPGTIGKWFYSVKTTEDKDYHCYSRSWHRRYGPKVTITHCITFGRMYYGKPKLLKVYPRALTGDYVVNAAIESGILKPVKSKVGLKIRLKNVFDAKLISEKRGYKIYSRTLAGRHYDWVIMSPLGMIYHDSDRANLVKGLHKKIRASMTKLALDGPLIDWAACKKLGFCDIGIRSFCHDFGLDERSKYRPQEIEAAVRARLDLVSPYMSEIRTLAKAYNYNIA